MKLDFLSPKFKILVVAGLLVLAAASVALFLYTRQAVPPNTVDEIVFRIPLLGEGRPSIESVDLNDLPLGWRITFQGPPGAEVHFADGTVGPITEWYGTKGGRVHFSGPERSEVVVRCTPP